MNSCDTAWIKRLIFDRQNGQVPLDIRVRLCHAIATLVRVNKHECFHVQVLKGLEGFLEHESTLLRQQQAAAQAQRAQIIAAQRHQQEQLAEQQRAALADLTETVTAFEQQESLLDLFQQSMVALSADDVLASQRPDIIESLEGMKQRGTYGNESLDPSMAAYLDSLRTAMKAALSNTSPSRKAWEAFESRWTRWLKKDDGGEAAISAFMQASHLQRIHAMSMADAVHDVLRQGLLPQSSSGIELHAIELPPLSPIARGKCAYVAGYAIYKVVMRESGKLHRDTVLIQCIDMIKFDLRQDALAEIGKNFHYRVDMEWTLGRDRGTTGHTGLRYPKPVLLPVFFEVEKLAAWYLDPTRLNNQSFQRLQYAAFNFASVLECWHHAQSVFLQEHRTAAAQSGNDVIPEALALTKLARVFHLVVNQYLRVWLRESKVKFEEMIALIKKDSLRKVIKNYSQQAKARYAAASAQGGPSNTDGSTESLLAEVSLLDSIAEEAEGESELPEPPARAS